MKINRVRLSIFMLTIILSAFASITIAYSDTCEEGFLLGYLYVSPDSGDNWMKVEDVYDILPGESLLIQIRGTALLLCDEIEVKVCNANTWHKVGVSGGRSEPFEWVCPQAPYSTEYLVQWKCSWDCVPSWVQEKFPNFEYMPCPVFTAMGSICPLSPGILHVIPEYAFGTVMSVLSLLSGLGIYSKYRRK